MSKAKPLVDVHFAIAQLSGNSDLLKRMFFKFSAEFSKVPEEINTLLAAGEIKAAKMKVHTTKGLSGNLGMLALFECSKQLDQQMREGNTSQETLDRFADLMLKTCDLINTIDLDVKEPATFSNDKVNNDNKAVFLQRLQHNEFIDDDTLHQYVDSLAMSNYQKQDLMTLVEELQYKKVIGIINNL